MDEAQRLLNREIQRIITDVKVAAIQTQNPRLMQSTHKLESIITDLLAQPEPAAREAALVAAIERIRNMAHEYGALPASIERLADHELQMARADISSAAAALLAQGERYRKEMSDLQMVAAHLELLDGPGVSDYLADALLIMRRVLKARATLAPGEET